MGAGFHRERRAEYRFGNAVSFGARFDGEFTSRAQTCAGTATHCGAFPRIPCGA
jgi:hypothetical protein